MSKFIIEGGQPLEGEITVSGNKNAALPLIAATVLTDQECLLENVPTIRDVDAMLALLEGLGKSVQHVSKGVVRIVGEVQRSEPEANLVRTLRASILYLGALLARTGKATIALPGGCIIGRRGVQSHFDALSALGAQIELTDDTYRARLVERTPANVFLTEASVTATENALLLAAAIPGETVIENAASEPHVADLASVLQEMGARIQGKGSNRLIIEGCNQLGGFRHRIVPDHIEAGTFAIAAACTRGQMVIRDARREHLRTICFYLQQMGVNLAFTDDATMVVRPSALHAPSRKIQVGIWPGFPTDLMSPMIVLATQAQGTTLCHDWMYESRMFFVDKLIAMGAQITLCDPHRVLVTGPTSLRGQELSSPDIRAGIALVIAALAAGGKSTIDNVELIDRGYENIGERLKKLGARIERED